MNVSELSIDPRGRWSPKQAERVLAVINPQAKPHKIFFTAVDLAYDNMPHRRVMLVPYCREHEIAIALGETCSECLRHVKT